jgi:hypothetical protein
MVPAVLSSLPNVGRANKVLLLRHVLIGLSFSRSLGNAHGKIVMNLQLQLWPRFLWLDTQKLLSAVAWLQLQVTALRHAFGTLVQEHTPSLSSTQLSKEFLIQNMRGQKVALITLLTTTRVQLCCMTAAKLRRPSSA